MKGLEGSFRDALASARTSAILPLARLALFPVTPLSMFCEFQFFFRDMVGVKSAGGCGSYDIKRQQKGYGEDVLSVHILSFSI